MEKCLVAEQQQASDIYQAVFLGADRRTVGQIEHVADDFAHVTVLHAGFTKVDEIGILREAAGIEEKRKVVTIADRAHGPKIFKTHRLPAADGTRHFLARVPEQEGRVLRVVVNPQVDPPLVVTAFLDRRMRGRVP